MKHPLVQSFAVFWICATIGSIFTKNADPFVLATYATFLIGLGYGMTHY